MKNRKLAVLIGVVIVAGGTLLVVDENSLLHLGGKGAGAPASAQSAMPALPVPVTAVVKKTIPIYFDYSARAESIRNLTLQAKVSSYLVEQAVPDGADVKTGDLLYRIDPRDFQASLDQMKAQVERDAASLLYLRSNLDRGTELAKSGFLAKDNFDQRTSSVAQTEAALTADRAAVRTAQLNLAYTEIRAPFPGRIGRNQAPVGTLVGAGGTVLNTLVQLDPIYVTFNPSETDLVELQKARTSRKIAAGIFMPGDVQPSHTGELSFLDNVVDRSTGTITARATIGNSDFTLLPGEYARVRVHVRDETDALMVPQTALGSSQLGKYVYVVGKGNVAEQHFVTLGTTDGPLISVTKGVSEGDQIITGNLQKLGPGSPVAPLPPKPQGS